MKKGKIIERKMERKKKKKNERKERCIKWKARKTSYQK